MRDRLSHLQAYSASSVNIRELGNATADSSSRKEHQRKTSQDHNPDSEMEAVFEEVQNIRRDIQLIHLDVKHLSEHYSQVHADLPNSATFQQDTNGITAGIKTQAENILARLRTMEKHAKELENKYGTDTAISRIARTQYANMSNSFRDAMMEYNKIEMSHKETCKMHIQRQMEIVGRGVTNEQIEQMLENNQWNVFSENILIEGRTARSALNQIESRHMELLELESRIRSIHEVFLDIAMLVEEQASMMDYILNNVQKTDAQMKGMLGKLKDANNYNRKHPFKKLFYRKC
ncbi:syntaxin-11-like [Trichomycterus rosablanca]|uniref:syntaxin-11-like n=1 Tax=Trichomycterus rosablanca TaxID=2290929 RepID=UPI002F36066A